jgi:hypothetical protein
MVRFINKDLKAHSYKGNERTFDIINTDTFNELTELLTWHVRYLGEYSHSQLTHLLQKTTIQLGITRPTDFNFVLGQKTDLKDLFLTLELILESLYELHPTIKNYFVDFIEDFNEFFLIHKVPLQIRYIPDKKEFYVEKIISEEISETITATLNNLSEHEKAFQDFKNSIKEFSAGNYPESIKLCCKSIEDYLCLVLKKSSCSSVESYYKEASKKLKIPQDLDNRFDSLIKYIHKYRSIDSHGRLENIEVEDIELVNESIIQFTMSILNYLKKKNEIQTISKI